MKRWTCPKCKREFGRVEQRHTCEPGLTIDDYFATAKEWERPVFDVVNAHLTQQGDVIVDPITIGILFKNGSMFCELRAMTRWVALGFRLGRKVESGKLSRKVLDYNGRFWHVINVTSPEQVDDEVLEWLAEAYHFAGGASTTAAGNKGSDPMVPDDIDMDF